MTFQRQIEQIYRMFLRHKKEHLSNVSIHPLSHLVNFLSHITSSRYNTDTPLLGPYFERLNSFDSQTVLSLRDVNNLSLLFSQCARLYPALLESMCSTLIETQSTSLRLIATFFRCLYKVNYKPEQINDLCSLARHLYENKDELRAIDMLWLALTTTGLFHQLDERLVNDIFSLAFLGSIDQLSSKKNGTQLAQPLFRLNQIVCIDQPQLNIPWFNDRFGQEVIIPGTRILRSPRLVWRTLAAWSRCASALAVPTRDVRSDRIEPQQHPRRKGVPADAHALAVLPRDW